jgi:hypothetical protein
VLPGSHHAAPPSGSLKPNSSESQTQPVVWVWFSVLYSILAALTGTVVALFKPRAKDDALAGCMMIPSVMMNRDCPIYAVEEALTLASQIGVRRIPPDFDPGDRRWRGILSTIARQFSNHATLLEQMDEFVAQAPAEFPDGFDRAAAEGDEAPCTGCGRRRWTPLRRGTSSGWPETHCDALLSGGMRR